MIKRDALQEPSALWLIREFLTTEDEQAEDLRPIGNKELYSSLAILIAGIAAVALTIGPLAIR